MTEDDELWTHLRAELAIADVEPEAAAAMQRHAHDHLRAAPRTLATLARGVESIVVAGLAAAQLAWAWSVVLG